MGSWKEYLEYHLTCFERCKEFIERPDGKKLAENLDLPDDLDDRDKIMLLDYIGYQLAVEEAKNYLLNRLDEKELDEIKKQIMSKKDDYETFESAIWLKKHELIEKILAKENKGGQDG
jgi:hypothetical protein